MTTAGWYGDAITGVAIFIISAERGTYRFGPIREKGRIAVRPFFIELNYCSLPEFHGSTTR